MSVKKIIFALALAMTVPCVAGAVESDDLQTQEALAMEYRFQIARTPSDEPETRETLYLAIVEDCPRTESAEEALWSLSDLYLDDFEEPREQEAQEVLEYFISHYPDSMWMPQVENRLLWLYEDGEDKTRALAIFEMVLKRQMPMAERLPVALRCADAYRAAGQAAKAREWYNRIISEGAGGAYPQVQTAKERLAAMKKK